MMTQEISIDLIDFSEVYRGSQDDLVDDIQKRGLRNPITVAKKRNGRYVIVDGFARVKAYKELGCTTIECRVING